jgi:hypothetical protein
VQQNRQHVFSTTNYFAMVQRINVIFEHKLAWKTCKTHTYSISVKQSLVSIILYNGSSNNATDINDFLCKILYNTNFQM